MVTPAEVVVGPARNLLFWSFNSSPLIKEAMSSVSNSEILISTDGGKRKETWPKSILGSLNRTSEQGSTWGNWAKSHARNNIVD